MRKLAVTMLIAALATHAAATRRVTVEQLRQSLAADIAAHRTDEDIAHQVGTLEMTQRLTATTLDRFAATLKLEPHTALALELLADQSAFLDPPASELPATAPPDAAAQQHMLDAARAYAVANWTRMPNLFVTRTTTRFDDSPQVLHAGDWPMQLGLHPVGTSSRPVTFRDGKEVAENASTEKAPPSDVLGLRSWGEFGPAVTVVLADTAKQKIVFSHWEQTATGLAAVFRYEVPRDASHYAVAYCCLVDQVVAGRIQFGYAGQVRSRQQVASIPRENELHTYHETPGYHGTIAIDPATGAVMRITIEAHLSNSDPLLRAATVIEYGPVTLGGRTYICPIHSVALSLEPASEHQGSMALNGVGTGSPWGEPLVHKVQPPLLLINETRFADYHRLGSTVRILTADGGAPSAPPVDAAPPAASAPSASADAPQLQTPQPPAQPPPSQTAAATPAAAPPPAPPAEPVVPEISMSAAASVPNQPLDASQARDADSYSIKVTSRLVDVGLVAYDKHGHPVTDLKADEIGIYDNGKKQELRGFTPPPPALSLAAPATSSGQQPQLAPAFTNHPADAAAPAQEAGSTVLVIDESHIAWADMSNARQQILKFLMSLKPGERVGLYSMNGLGFHVLQEITANHTALIARMKAFLPSAQSAAEAQDEETRNRQHFDEVHNVEDLNHVNGNHDDDPDSNQPIDPQLMTMGDDPECASLVILAQVARHLAALPGQKKLVWVSSDNVFADWTDQSVGIEKSPKNIAGFTLRAQEAMNDAHAAVYPFDVSQIETGAISADLQHRNVELTQASADTASLAGAAMPRDNTPGRISANMSQDLHPVQGPVRDLAAATGGRVIRRAGDLNAQLDGIVGDGHSTYMLSFSPAGPADDAYHHIELKVTGHKGLTLRYRAGYIFEKEPATLRERFQQAVWRPMDVGDIAIKAATAAETGGAEVTLAIAARDLGLEQQADRWMDRLDIFFLLRDDAGLHAKVRGETLGLRLKPQTYQRLVAGDIPYERFVPIKQTSGSLRVVVVDENTGRMGSVTIPVSALAESGAQAQANAGKN
ncbi:MAG TPA: VWA domain-containing protein [Terracidiphilus sp.]|nr:VWA domain-containing protein [Terracidiphilus sp.]